MLTIVMRVTGCILIIGSCSGMGWLFGDEIKRRIDDLKAAKTVAMLLRGDIRFAHTALPEALENVAKRHEGSLAPFLKKIASELKKYTGATFSQIWCKAVAEDLKSTALTKKDKEYLNQFGEQLGYLDKDMQLNHIDLFISQMEEQIKEISIDAKDKIRMYQSLGVLFGILVTIVIL